MEEGMNQTRRYVMKAGSGAGLLAMLAAAGFVVPASAADWNKAAFDGKTVADAFKALGAGAPANSGDIIMKAPDIAENGAVVPVGIESKIPGTESIALLIEKNPNPMAASFDIPAGTELSVTTRVKMAETSNIYALVKANGKYYVAKKEVKVTLGGCGG
jgi:sulfur-oxidizing protein SoxY